MKDEEYLFKKQKQEQFMNQGLVSKKCIYVYNINNIMRNTKKNIIIVKKKKKMFNHCQTPVSTKSNHR